MSRIRLNLRQLPATEKIAKAKQILTALTGNASFPSPTPPLETITAAVNAFDAAYAATQAARQEVKTKSSDQSSKEDLLDQLMVQLGAYVGSVAGSNDNLIHSAGMDTKAPNTAPVVPTPPTGLTATTGVHSGEIDLSWSKVVKAKTYLVERSPDPPTAASWTHAGASTKSSTTISGLTSDTKVWFRVAAIGSLGQSGWSDPVIRLVP